MKFQKSVLALLLATGMILFRPALAADEAEQDRTSFSLGITGSMSSDLEWNHTKMLRYIKAQDLFLAIADEPRSRDFVLAALAELPFGLKEIMDLRLLREENGFYYLNFNFLTQEDQKLIFDVGEKYGRSLTRTYQKHWGEFEVIFQGFDQPWISQEYLAYIIIGLMSLDWDGLAITSEMGLRSTATHTEGENAYTPWAKQEGDLVSLQELYWGSHNENFDQEKFTFTSFGDHHSLPRFALPDIIWGTRVSLNSAPEALTTLHKKAGRSAMFQVEQAFGKLLYALNENAGSFEEIQTQMGWDEDMTRAYLNFLTELQILTKGASGYQPAILVLGPGDQEMVKSARELSWQIMEDWLEENYDLIKADLSGLSAVSQGVPFEVMFTEVWHFIFGLTNRDMARAGLFPDPYGDERTYKGFLTVLWADKVYEDFNLQ